MPIVTRLEEHGSVARLHTARAVLPQRPIYWVSVYAWNGILFDAGMAWAQRETVAFAQQQSVSTVLVTHEHEDHAGNLKPLLEAGLPAWAPAKAVTYLERGPRIPLYRHVTWGTPPPVRGVQAIHGERLRVNDRAFRVIDTPGHSWRHVAFQDEETGWVFAGDAYLGKFKATRRVESVPTQVETLRALAALDAPVIFPAHGPILTKPKETLWDTIEYFENLHRRARAMRDQGRSAREIRKALLGRERMICYFSGFEFSCENVVRSLLGEAPEPEVIP